MFGHGQRVSTKYSVFNYKHLFREIDTVSVHLCIRTFKDVIDGVAFDCNHEVQQSYESKTEWGAFQHYFQIYLNCTYKDKLNPDFPVYSRDMEPDLLSSSTLSDFQIICTLAIGEFGRVDLVRVAQTVTWISTCGVLFQIPCFYHVNCGFSPLSGAVKEQHQCFCHEGPEEETNPQRTYSEGRSHLIGGLLSIHSQVKKRF